MNHEKSAGSADSLEEAKTTGQAICDSEVIPALFSIYEDAQFLEDIERTDGLDLSEQTEKFNAKYAIPKNRF